MDLQERALLGLPIETDYGRVHPLSIIDYVEHEIHLQIMSFDSKRVLHEYRLQQDEKVRETKDFTSSLEEVDKQRSLKEIIIGLMPVYFNSYVAMVSLTMYKDIESEEERIKKAHELLINIDNEGFELVREAILQTNAQGTQTAFLDPTVQKWKEKSLRFHANQNKEEPPNVATLLSSVVTYTGIPYSEIAKWNYIQLIHTFKRIDNFKSYDTTTLFMTVAGDKVKPIGWDKNFKIHHDSNTSESFAIELNAFKKQMSQTLE